ncbi:hypothetical protein E0H51_30540 [Rhizobium leguminosarum bv. viciae]|uniref:hypothetical protein n=1 Tax=Rhizobium leguminosarum TaxID=384 RepID=UPI00103E8C3B|nr:hypothetical protein [Rhizobium leguminosarum]TBY69720.1 hypothetical protein E0H51_30540 [Rhizobium leguminosarum bv. viciae]
MTNETPPDKQPPKSASITDNNFSFQPGAGVTLDGFHQTITSRNNFVGLGGDGLVIKAPVDVPPAPAPEPTPEVAPPVRAPLPPKTLFGLRPIFVWAISALGTIAIGLFVNYLTKLFDWT